MPIFGSNSRYKRSEVVRLPNGKESPTFVRGFDFLDPQKVGDQVLKFQVTPAFAHRPDLIANRVYGSPQLYWVVIMFNSPNSSAFRWPVNGEEITLPVEGLVVPEL